MFIEPAQTLAACHVGTGETIADFGAGSGAYARAAARLATAGTIFAIEVHKEMVAGLSRTLEHDHIKNVHVLWGDIEVHEGTTLKSDSVDLVILSNVLFTLEDKAGCAKEALRVLKPGGRALVVDWTESFAGMGPAAHHVFDRHMATDLFERIGFTKHVDTLPAGDHHYAILFHKK